MVSQVHPPRTPLMASSLHPPPPRTPLMAKQQADQRMIRAVQLNCLFAISQSSSRAIRLVTDSLIGITGSLVIDTPVGRGKGDSRWSVTTCMSPSLSPSPYLPLPPPLSLSMFLFLCTPVSKPLLHIALLPDLSVTRPKNGIHSPNKRPATPKATRVNRSKQRPVANRGQHLGQHSPIVQASTEEEIRHLLRFYKAVASAVNHEAPRAEVPRLSRAPSLCLHTYCPRTCACTCVSLCVCLLPLGSTLRLSQFHLLCCSSFLFPLCVFPLPFSTDSCVAIRN